MHKVGIIGYGKMGQIRKKACEETGKAEVCKLFDINKTLDPLDSVMVDSYEEIILDKNIDTVIICTPNYLNKKLTIMALDSRKNVFCEKPPAFTAADVMDIQKSEKLSGKHLMYGFNHRHHGSIKYMKRLINDGEYGRIIWMRGRYGKSEDQSFFNTWRSKKELAGGGILMDQGIHMLDLFLHLGGDFDTVKSFISNQYWKCEIEDNAFVLLKNSISGLVASLHSTMTQWRHLFSLEIFMERGYLVLNGLKTSSGTYGDEVLNIAKNRTIAPASTWKDEEKITFETDFSFRNEMDHFFSCIETKSPIKYGNSQDALKIMTLLDTIYAEGLN